MWCLKLDPSFVHPSRFRRFYTILLQSLLLPRSLTETKAHQNEHPPILNHPVVVLPTHLRDALCHCPGTWKYARYQPHDTHTHNTWGCTGYVGCVFFFLDVPWWNHKTANFGRNIMEQQQQDLILSWSSRQSLGPWDDWFEDKLIKRLKYREWLVPGTKVMSLTQTFRHQGEIIKRAVQSPLTLNTFGKGTKCRTCSSWSTQIFLQNPRMKSQQKGPPKKCVFCFSEKNKRRKRETKSQMGYGDMWSPVHTSTGHWKSGSTMIKEYIDWNLTSNHWAISFSKMAYSRDPCFQPPPKKINLKENTLGLYQLDFFPLNIFLTYKFQVTTPRLLHFQEEAYPGP